MGDEMAMALLHEGMDHLASHGHGDTYEERRTGSYQCLTGDVSEQSEHLDGTWKAKRVHMAEDSSQDVIVRVAKLKC